MDLIFSDLHANLHAMQVMLRFARRRGIRRYVSLGDLVGYGPHPNQVLERVLQLRPRIMVRGNHDRVCSSGHEMEGFNGPARQSAEWTHNRLRDDLRRALLDLPEGPLAVEGGYAVAHGSPTDEDTYLLGAREVAEAFDGFEGPLCFFGHTHLPGCWELDEASHALRWIDMEPEAWMPLRPGCRYLANPGSVGQPRDRDNRASFMTCDMRRKRIRLHRMDYDWDAEAKAILAAGLHPSLATRLAAGM